MSIQLPQFFIRPCCPENGTEALVNITGGLINNGVFIYNGSNLSIPGTDVTLVTGACYTISSSAFVGNVTSIALADLTGFYLNSRCDDPTVDAACPDCTPDPGNYYIKAVPCCGGDAIFFKGEGYTGGRPGANKQPSGSLSGSQQLIPSIPQFSINNFSGVYLFLGFVQQSQQSLLGLEVGQCYTFSFNSISDPSSEITQAEYDLLGYPPYISQLDFVSKTDCDTVDAVTGERICPDCEEICYRLTSCTGIIINTVQDLSLYVGTYIELFGYTGSWFVEINNGICQDPSRTLKISGTGATPCPCLCYEVIGESGGISYIDCDGVSQYTYGPAKFCAQAPPLIKGVEGEDYTLITGTDCVDGECVEQCFLLTNCDPTAYPEQDATLVSTLQSLSSYVGTNRVVVLAGYDGCWNVTLAVECDCPVDVTVIRNYIDCEECLGITAYKLSNCEKINEVVYTLQDFSAYVGQVIKDDCACWVVEEIDYQPPSETTIVDPIVFEDCNTCLTTYYTLTDCDDSESVIISSTNLSPYVGQVVKIEGCNPCYEVALYEDAVAPALWEEVTVTEASASCPECKQLAPRCSTVFNNSTEDRTFTYINANGDSEETEIVKSGHFSLRTCVQYWDEPDTFIYNYYGDCTVYEYDNTPLPGECNCIDVSIETGVGITVYSAVHTGEFFNGVKVFDLIISEVEYKIWGNAIGGWGISTVVGTTQDEIGFIKSGILDCPVADNTVWTVSGDLPGGVVVLSISTLEGTCATITTKEGHCVQYFPNNRKVRPGYNTPICSADKYDKITCNAADIMYKKVLELRYGISDCCPEENEKWLIKKELIELQALTDPNYTCDPLTDCCGQRVSSCSCNS
jgi:hypothetical protein